jgi:alcohol dehydrogenase (cytochrome c)
VEGKRWAGVLATAGGLLFYADPDGDLVAVDQKDGKRLWSVPTNQTIKSAPITFADAAGRQYVAIAAGADILCFGLP